MEIISEQIKTSSVRMGAEGTRLGQKTDSTILVVEDIAEIALHMKRRLVERGHRVIWAQDPADAIHIAEQNPPSIILTDLDLPKLPLLLELVSNHGHLSKLTVAAIDLNHHELVDDRVKILRDFDALEQFIQSLDRPDPVSV